MNRKPELDKITGDKDLDRYITHQEIRLTWRSLWNLFMLRLLDPRRADRFVMRIVNFGIEDNQRG